MLVFNDGFFPLTAPETFTKITHILMAVVLSRNAFLKSQEGIKRSNKHGRNKL